MSNDNTIYKTQIIYNSMACIVMDVILHIVYKAHGGKSTLIVVFISNNRNILYIYQAFRKHEA